MGRERCGRRRAGAHRANGAKECGGGEALLGGIFGRFEGLAERGHGRGAVVAALEFVDGFDGVLNVGLGEPVENFVRRGVRGGRKGERGAGAVEEGLEALGIFRGEGGD